MITREDTINAWNSYIATKQHYNDISTERSQNIAAHERRASRWDKVFNTSIVMLFIFLIVLMVEGKIIYQDSPWVGVPAAFGLAVSMSSAFISVKNSDAAKALEDDDEKTADAYRTFLDTTVGYVRTLGHTTLAINYSDTAPHIITTDGVITIAFTANDTTPELLLNGHIIQSTYRDTSTTVTGMGGQRILTA